ncbi:T9SS type A sorting domain-containing protein [Algoriphagus lacus]|nr:T9SS type A sorting domain-containing protein [Algoriphagus lacus]
MKRALLISFLIGLNLLFGSFQAPNSSVFRVYPYLQVYGQGRIQITWISSQILNSKIELYNEQGTKIWTSAIEGDLIPEIYYTTKELNEEIPGLTKGSWLKGSEAYKYVAVLPELPNGDIYSYQIFLGSEIFSSSFRPVPDDKNWTSIRFIALSDSEMEPVGRVSNRAWYPGNPLSRPFSIPDLWRQKFGTTTEQGFELPNYFLTESKGFEENLKIINNRAPEFILMPGDLVQGGGYQPAWDEFFRHMAGEVGKGLSIYPIIPALGNWESFGATNGGYGINDKGDYLPRLGRERFHEYFETPTTDPLQKHRQSYYRVDYGPITILTLDSNNGNPDQKTSDFDGIEKLKGTEFTVPGTDTQENFTKAEYESNGGTDLSGFGPGTDQYKWLEENLKTAKEAGQLIFVQYHHIAYSSGEHGVPMNHELSIGQVGTPLRILNPLLEEYGVIAVFSGHDELFERSFVDENGDGKGVMYYDVGVAADGMRGEKRKWNTNPLETLNYNPFRKWTADQNSVENWNTGGPVPLLEDGGKHYGHLEVNLQKVKENGQDFAKIKFSPVYTFPVLNSNYDLVRVERRVYADEIELKVLLQTETVVPVFKDTVKISLDYSGLGELKPSQFLVNSGDQGLYTFTYSRDPKFTCTDLGWKDVTVTAKDASNQSWSSLIKVNVVDELPPYFDAANATYLFDPVVGKVQLSFADFFISDIQDNCTVPLTISQSRMEITCADIYQNPDAPKWQFPVVLTATDQSGNTFSKTVTAIIGNVIESKKVSITSLDPLTDNGTSTLRLGNELEYQVLAWTKNGQLIPNQTGREILVNSSGEYQATLQLATGCIVGSKRFILEKDLPEEYTNDVNLALNESGKATLTNEAVFQPGAVPSSLVVLSKNEFDCNDVGTQKVKVTINYPPENSSSIATTEFWINLIVKDNLNPILVTKTPSLAFDKVKGVLPLKPEDFVSSVSDNCGIQSVVLDKSQITCADYELPIEIMVTATDLSGNQTSKLVIVTASAFESQKISISPSGTQQAYAGEPLKLTLGSEFAYTVEEWLKDGQKIPLQKETSLNVTESGTYWARILPNGGCIVESLKVTVSFIDKPYTGVKEVIELQLDASGKATLKPEDVFLSWPLLDPNLDIKLSQSEFTCADIGEKQVSITIKNQSGKTWEEKTLVKIQDKRAPILVPKNYAAEFDVTKGVLELKPENFITSLTDNCQIKEVTINKVNATCEDLGKETTVAIRAVDMVGNVTEATAVLTLIRIENQKVTISGPAQLCQGEKGVLTLTSQASFEVIRWRRNGTEIPGQTGKTLEVSDPGKYHAVIRYTGACLSETAEFEVKVNPLPTGEISVDGNILRAPEGSFTYQWFRNGEKLNGATSRTLTVDLMGEYLVELTSASGCVAKLKPVTLTISGLGGKQVSPPKDLKMYPNPASELVTLELPDGVLSGNPQIMVYSSEGKDVGSSLQITELNSQKVEIRLTALAKGTYLVWVISQNQQSYFGKLVIVD